MERVAARERRRETPAQRLLRETGALTVALTRLAVLSALLTPLLLASFLTVDLPVYRFDRLFDVALLKPSNWLSVGGLTMSLGVPLVILMTRKFGGDEASRAVTASWAVAAFLVFAGLAELAPALEDRDLPSVRFAVAFAASAMLGQYVAAAAYDVLRGGGRWWRAPLIAAFIGFGAQTLVYFPAVYWEITAPWVNYAVSDYAVKAGVAFASLPIYRLLLKPLRPLGGYGR